jgi:hypothetical protein
LEAEIRDPKSDMYKVYHPTDYSPCSKAVMKFVIDFVEEHESKMIDISYGRTRIATTGH